MQQQDEPPCNCCPPSALRVPKNPAQRWAGTGDGCSADSTQASTPKATPATPRVHHRIPHVAPKSCLHTPTRCTQHAGAAGYCISCCCSEQQKLTRQRQGRQMDRTCAPQQSAVSSIITAGSVIPAVHAPVRQQRLKLRFEGIQLAG